ncbi:MAG TPA: efflux RND transporter periplasmic adaptor subunit [Nitrospiria bacterium]|nr:efflux RND transporter periplasmic adaptor subunit [Nitrospiria bacterium]
MTFLRKKWYLIVGLLIVAILGFFFFRDGKSAVQYKTKKVEQGEITATVSATGKVNAVVTVQVGSQVSGTIQRLFADFNSEVKKGQIVAQIDPALFEAQVEQARAKLANDEANQEKARVVVVDAKRNLGRMEELLSKNLVAQSDKDTTQTAYDSALAEQKAAEAQVLEDRASLKLTETNLRYTTIRSPVDGIVISRTVDVGQTVAASLQAPTLFTIAQDLTEMQVDTSVDEADIGKVRLGQESEFTVDAYPTTPFHGTVHDIYNEPLVVQNVVTYDAIIRVKNPDLKLKPGMTANITIKVGHRDNAVKLPNAALRYSPERAPGAESSPKAGKADAAKVWILQNGAPVPVSVALGLNDGNFTEVVSGPLKPGDEAIVEKIQKNGSSQGGGRPPFMRF